MILLLLATGLAFADAKGKSHDKRMMDELEQKRKMHQQELEHLNKLPADKAKDWTVHEDVDGSFYWFSRSLKRSVRDPPKGWTKNSRGKWVAPARQRDEL